MTLSYHLGCLETILVHPTWRENFAGKLHSNFYNIWDLVVSILHKECSFYLKRVKHFRVSCSLGRRKQAEIGKSGYDQLRNITDNTYILMKCLFVLQKMITFLKACLFVCYLLSSLLVFWAERRRPKAWCLLGLAVMPCHDDVMRMNLIKMMMMITTWGESKEGSGPGEGRPRGQPYFLPPGPEHYQYHHHHHHHQQPKSSP